MLTHHVVIIEAQLVGLAGLEDLHADELDLHLAVLEHLLGSREQLAILPEQHEETETHFFDIAVGRETLHLQSVVPLGNCIRRPMMYLSCQNRSAGLERA